MILNILLFIMIGVCAYMSVEKMVEFGAVKKINKYIAIKNEKYYEDLLKYYDKSKKIKLKKKITYLKKINILIDRCNISRGIIINPITIIFFGIFCVILSYTIAFSFFKIVILSFLISIPLFYLPFYVLNFIATSKEKKIEKVFLNFLLQLKNHTKINNDIIAAMKEVKTLEPLQGYIRIFLIEVSSGVKFEKAIENFKEKISIKQMKMFLENLKHCYLYGGNFSELIDTSYHMIKDIQDEKNKREQETKSARIVLFILICLDLLVYISFIRSNHENFLIMRKSVIGNLILYWNFVSMWLLVWISGKVKKLDY